MSAGRKRTVNKRPGEEGYQPPISIKLPQVITGVLEGLGLADHELNIEGFKGRLIIRIEVIEIKLDITFDPDTELSEESTSPNGEEYEEN
jgi:hypothetical protein